MNTERNRNIVSEATLEGKDPHTRRIMFLLALVAFLSLIAALIAVGYGWNKSRESALSGARLGEQVRLACADPSIRIELGDICGNAREVAEGEDPEIQDAEIDDPEQQDPEIQEPEIQDPDRNDPDRNDRDPDDPEQQDDEVQDGEINDPDPDDPEVQDEEVQNEEVQDPEVDDPDPASPYDFSFTFTVPGPGGTPGTTYHVTCNSGTGDCVVTQEVQP